MPQQVSTFRLYLMRTFYLLMFVGFGSLIWRDILTHKGAWDPVRGVAFSFWAALSLLMGIGLKYPLQMLPLVLLQLVYKVVWLIVVALPASPAANTAQLTKIFLIVAIADVVVIPWSYVLENYLKRQGDRWRPATRAVLSPSRRESE